MRNSVRITDHADDRSFRKVHYCQSSVDSRRAEARVITLRPGVTEDLVRVYRGERRYAARRGLRQYLASVRVFQGRALVVLGSGATVERLTIDGNRAKLAERDCRSRRTTALSQIIYRE